MCGIAALPLRAKFSSSALLFAPYIFLQQSLLAPTENSGFAERKPAGPARGSRLAVMRKSGVATSTLLFYFIPH
ncbi:hypothetical protein [Variovorax sp. W2I14]|uniref:hypothetical protein n=1 Tax=Variovorax sp. W2I14 TaxID=3042290 RepID=UPI003D20C5F5